jgi:hypothetical protein
MLRHNPDKPLYTPQNRPMYDDGPIHRAFSPSLSSSSRSSLLTILGTAVLEVKLDRKLEIQLDCGALEGST